MAAMNYRIKIEPEKFYHIWNRGNNRENLFYTVANYEYFLRLYDQFLDPVAETYAFCLLPNHFHLLIRTKSFLQVSPADGLLVSPADRLLVSPADRLLVSPADRLLVSPAGETKISNPVSLAFQRFFTAYSQAINIQERRTGSLFQKPFKRLEITTTQQLANLVHYIHTNPQKHGIIDDFRHYPWSSYERVIRDRPSKLKKDEVIEWFNDKTNYVDYHSRGIDLDELKKIMIE
jgi:putative transposase